MKNTVKDGVAESSSEVSFSHSQFQREGHLVSLPNPVLTGVPSAGAQNGNDQGNDQGNDKDASVQRLSVLCRNILARIEKNAERMNKQIEE